MGCEKKRFLNKFNYLAMNLLYSDGEGVLPSPELVGKGLIPPYIFKKFFYNKLHFLFHGGGVIT